VAAAAPSATSPGAPSRPRFRPPASS
jgi:hypothetical protein